MMPKMGIDKLTAQVTEIRRKSGFISLPLYPKTQKHAAENIGSSLQIPNVCPS